MTDDSRFRSRRGQEHTQPHQSAAVARVRRGEDPLAELARLIGQEDPFAEFAPNSRPNDTRTAGNGSGQRYARGQDTRVQDVRGYDGRGQDRRRPAEPTRAPEPAYDDAYDPRHAEAPRGNGRGTYAYRGGRDTRQEREEYAQPAVARRNGDGGYAPARAERAPAQYERDQQAYSEQDQDAHSDPRYARRAPAEPAYDDGAHDQYRGSDYDPAYVDDAYLPAHGDEVYVDAPHRSGRRWFMLLAATLAFVLIAGAGVFAYRALFGSKFTGALPKMIKSESGPSKMVPAPASAEAPGQKQIYDRIGGDRPAGERIVSREEKPIEGAKGQAARPAAVAAGSQAIPSSSQASPAPTEPKRVRTVSVRADGSVVGDQARGGVTGSTPRGTPTPASPGSQPLPLNSYASQSAQPAAPESVPTPAARATRTAAPAQDPNNPWADITSPQPSMPAAAASSQAVASAPAAARGPAPIVAVNTPPPAGSYVVQVSSQKNEADAQASWLQLQSKYSAVLAGQSAAIRRVDLGDRGVFYRAQLGPYQTRNQATTLCQSLKNAGGECVVQRN